MSAQPQASHLTPEEYLLGENDRADGTRYEYINGQTYAMAGASRNHNRLSLEFAATLLLHLRGTSCQIFHTDMKVGIRSKHEDHFYYPDIQVSCEPETDKYYNTAPCLIVEVLSDSTARIDRTEKLMTYTKLPSLQEYVLCSQDSPAIEIYRKRMQWKAEYYGGGEQFLLESIDLEVLVNDLYRFLFHDVAEGGVEIS